MNRRVTEEFLRSAKKTYVDEIRREDLFDFHAALRKRGSADRTVANYHMRTASFLRFAGADLKIIPPVPRDDETLPTIYTRDRIASILGAAGPYMHLAIGLALKCGLREQEIVYLPADSLSMPFAQPRAYWSRRPVALAARERGGRGHLPLTSYP